MKREDIEKAASKHSASLWDKNIIDCSRDFDFVYDSFVAGAEWRINSVWHDIKEKPKLNKFFIFQNECNEWETDCLYQQTKWKLYVAANDLVRWAYIEDLMPDTEE